MLTGIPIQGIPALLPVVEHGFLNKSSGSSSTVDTEELETQREVMVAMLLRLVEYHQVVKEFTLNFLSSATVTHILKILL